MEDDAAPVEQAHADRWVALEFDFLKHLTSLSLLAIGGTVTFAGSIFEGVPDKRSLWTATALFAAAAVLALTGQARLLKTLRAGHEPKRLIAIQRDGAMATLGIGVGVLIAFSLEALG